MIAKPTLRRRTLLLAAAAVTGAPLVRAQAYPDRPIRWLLPSSPGSAVDITARKLQPALSGLLGQPLVVENKAGSGGVIAFEQLAKAPPDGYTIGLVSSTFCVAPSLYKLRFDPKRDIQPISIMSSGPVVLAVHPKLPVTTYAELIKLAKSRGPAKPLLMGNPGIGTTVHFAAAQMAIAAGIDVLHVPYKGTNTYITDFVGGVVEAGFLPPVVAMPLVKEGKLHVLGISSAARLPSLPNLPTLAELGLRGFDVDGWLAMVAPAKVPLPILQRLNREAVRAMHQPEFEKFVADSGGAVVANNMLDAQKVFEREFNQVSIVVKRLGIKPE